jgi:endogenous inhibitor of DNA gyrase (YacG/DUF329 family)
MSGKLKCDNCGQEFLRNEGILTLDFYAFCSQECYYYWVTYLRN